jgi:deoxyribose-phosphate aldolase
MNELNRTLDAAILKPEMSRAEVESALQLCLSYNTRTACVRPCDIALARERLAGSEVGVCVVLGFPHGDQLPQSKADEARRYVAAGVDEIDMVANFGWARSGDWEAVEADIAGVAAVTRPAGVPLKVIFETTHLTGDEIRALVAASIRAGADFVKTSTGFNGPGASEEAVKVMVEAAGGKIKVKPSGGIRDAATARKYLAMGARRLGVGFGSVPALCDDNAPAEGHEGAY